MFSNRLAVAGLATACIAAAAAGGYLASRQNAVPAPASAQTQPAAITSPASAPAGSALPAERPVQETEAIIGDAPKPTTNVASTSDRTSKRAEPAQASRAPVSTSTRQRTSATARHEPPPLASTWPSSATQPPPTAPPASENTATAPRNDERPVVEVPHAPEPPQKTFVDLVVPADSVIGLQIENKLSSETAKVEDKVDAKVTRDVKVGDRVAIPSGTRALGSIMLVERGGKFKEQARLGIRFHTLVLADGTHVPISTDTIYRDGQAPSNASAAKVGGGAVGGAILGAILGGGKGAAIGAATGAAGGSAAVLAGDRSTVVVQPGTTMTVRVLSPVTITSEREDDKER